MPLQLKCPKCAHRFPEPPSTLALKVRCPACGHVVRDEGHSEKPVDAYICHSPNDGPAADTVCRTLEANAIRCWIASRDLMASENWVNAVMQAIDQSRMVVLVMSARALASRQVLAELSRAANQRLPVVTLRVDDAAPAGNLLAFLSTGHMQQVKDGQMQQGADALVDLVCRVLGRKRNPVGRGGKRPAATGRSSSGRWAFVAIGVLACVAGGYVLVRSGILGGLSAGDSTGGTIGNTISESSGYGLNDIVWNQMPDNRATLSVVGGPDQDYAELATIAFDFVPPDEVHEKSNSALPGVGLDSNLIFGLAASDADAPRKALREFGYWYATRATTEFTEMYLLAGHGFNRSGNAVGFTESTFQELVDALNERGLDSFACVGQPPIRESRGERSYSGCRLIRRATSQQPVAPDPGEAAADAEEGMPYGVSSAGPTGNDGAAYNRSNDYSGVEH